jgi:hypothetical protein
LELKYKLLKSEYDKESESMKEAIESLESQKQRAVDLSKNLDLQKVKMLEETEGRYKQ